MPVMLFLWSVYTAIGAGDPHIFTLDGLKYTFNGRGEFVLLEHVDDIFVLQGRMENIIGQMVISATVFSAIVGKQNDSDAVQFEINQQFNGIDVIVDGQLINMEGLYEISFNNVTVFNFGNNSYAARFSTGCFIQVREENGFISVLTVALPDSFKGNTRGLMGNYNGDMTDDLMPRNSTDPLHHNASLHDIHYQFGITCEAIHECAAHCAAKTCTQHTHTHTHYYTLMHTQHTQHTCTSKAKPMAAI